MDHAQTEDERGDRQDDGPDAHRGRREPSPEERAFRDRAAGRITSGVQATTRSGMLRIIDAASGANAANSSTEAYRRCRTEWTAQTSASTANARNP